ncbi:hypothetical protein QZH41_001743 [Actinostola sp. cb2023]|nr:hypothetical protein QZH41_001743 [Actinostola sp. cb2023]
MRADNTIREIATQKNDNKILAIVSRELVAAEACYHRTCYKSYTRPEASCTVTSEGSSESSDDEYARLESDAYQMLFDYIRSEVMENEKVALYAKATEIAWKHDKFKDIVIRMGMFHTVCTLLSILGKRFQDAGLRDICIESGVITEGSVSGVLEGRKYNRAIRFHKLMYEALQRLVWEGFQTWIDKFPEKKEFLQDVVISLKPLYNDVCQKEHEKVLSSEMFSEFITLYDTYLEYLRKSNGKLCSFWMSYIDIVEIMLNLVRASREGHWELHLSAVKQMIPWCFAYNNLNYARYMSAYLSEMSHLKETHPEVCEYLKSGGFSVQIGTKNPFGRIPTDQACEETVNKDTQTAGGTKGFSLKAGAVSKYYLVAEYRSIFLKQLKDMLDLTKSNSEHSDLQSARISRDEADVRSLLAMLEEHWINPISNEQQDIVCLSTGKVATPKIQEDLLNAKAVGEKAYEAFRVQRLETDPPKVKFHDSLKKSKLQTFSELNKKVKVKSKSAKEIILKADRALFAQMIIIAENRKLQMREVLCHPLGPLPWSLSTADGSLRKTTKSTLAKELQKNVPAADIIPEPSACIIDGIALVQRLKERLPSRTQKENREGLNVEMNLEIFSPNIRYNSGEKFLLNPKNKKAFTTFVAKEWQQEKYRKKLTNKVLFVACEEECHQISSESANAVQDLKSTQEEADTRIILHIAHAARSGYDTLIVASEDTDVFILCLTFKDMIPSSIFFKCGMQTRVRYVSISSVAQAIGQDICHSLLGVHAYTGCDTVSAFAGRGKIGALRIVKEQRSFQEMFKCLGMEWELSDDLFKKLQDFTCHMYCSRPGTNDINELRYRLFCAKKGNIDSMQLPPCADCLFKHACRANYQAAIWKRSLECCPVIPSPIRLGWCQEENQLAIDWMSGEPAPTAILELLSCSCKRSCKLPSCSCLVNGLKCTDMCKLLDCENRHEDSIEETVIYDNDQEDDDIEED